MSLTVCKTPCAARHRPACRWLWWWLLWIALTAATTNAAAGERGRRDVFDYLEGVGTTLDLNDRRGRTLRWLLRRLAEPGMARAEDEAEEEQQAAEAPTSFFAANKFTLLMPPDIRLSPRRRRRRRYHSRNSEGDDDTVPAAVQDVALQGEAGQGAAGGASSESRAGVERQEDAVPDVSRWYERERQETGAWLWRDEEAKRPREVGEKLLEEPTRYRYVAGCVAAACCVACCLVWRDGRGAARTKNYAERCRDLLEVFVNYKDLVVRLKKCLWRFEALGGARYDDLLVYVARELQEVSDTYQRQVIFPRGGMGKRRRKQKKR